MVKNYIENFVTVSTSYEAWTLLALKVIPTKSRNRNINNMKHLCCILNVQIRPIAFTDSYPQRSSIYMEETHSMQ